MKIVPIFFKFDFYYLIDTCEPHFVENGDEQIANDDEWQGGG